MTSMKVTSSQEGAISYAISRSVRQVSASHHPGHCSQRIPPLPRRAANHGLLSSVLAASTTRASSDYAEVSTAWEWLYMPTTPSQLTRFRQSLVEVYHSARLFVNENHFPSFVDTRMNLLPFWAQFYTLHHFLSYMEDIRCVY